MIISFLKRLKVLNSAGNIDRSTVYGYFAGALAAFTVLATRSVSTEVLGLLGIAATAFHVDKHQGQKQQQIDTEKGELSATVQALTEQVSALQGQAAEIEALKTKVTDIRNRMPAPR